MDKFIYIPLLLLFFIAGFTQLYYNSQVNIDYEGIQSQTIIGNVTENETTTTLTVEKHDLVLDFDMTTGLVIVIVSAIALGLIGINILGSGLNSFSIKIMWNGIVFYGLWLIFSVLGFNFFSTIPFFGLLFWVALTLVYTIGVFGKMGSE